MEQKTPFYYVTASIPYVNGEPHIGHALEFFEVDMIARYWRQKLGEHQVMAVTGTDDNSLKNVQAAEKAGQNIAEFVAEHSQVFHDLYTTLNLSFDDFISTRQDRHIKGAQKLWSSFKPEDVYKKQYKGLYCVGCETFYTEKEFPDGICGTHKTPLEIIEEENYFFKLSNYQQALLDVIESGQLKIYPEEKRNEILSFIKGGLEDFSISRSQQRAKNWGVTVPNDPNQVMYVWVDALSNYINVLGYAHGDETYKHFWEQAEHRVHVIGKDIIRFHAVYWPAMLMSAGLPLPTDMYVHGFFMVEGQKISKSLGNVIHPNDLVQEYGLDAVRYYLLREMPYASDGNVAKERMEDRYAELANTLGNLVHRVAAMGQKYFEGKIEFDLSKDEETESKLQSAMQTFNLKEYTDVVYEVMKGVNEYIDKEKPFSLVKTDEQAAKNVLSKSCAQINRIATYLWPIMPSASDEIKRRYQNGNVQSGDPLFPRRDITKK